MKDNMQKVTVLTTFRDKDNFAKVYTAGSEVEFSKERAEHLKRLGLVGFDAQSVNVKEPKDQTKRDNVKPKKSESTELKPEE